MIVLTASTSIVFLTGMAFGVLFGVLVAAVLMIDKFDE